MMRRSFIDSRDNGGHNMILRQWPSLSGDVTRKQRPLDKQCTASIEDYTRDSLASIDDTCGKLTQDSGGDKESLSGIVRQRVEETLVVQYFC